MSARLPVLLSLFASMPAFAGGNITYLDITENSVVFATDEAKASAVPSCVASGNEDKWAVSLQTDEGRAIYSLLMTSMAAKSQIGVSSASDCSAFDGHERPARVWFDASQATSTSSSVPMIKLAPDLDFPAQKVASQTHRRVMNVDVSQTLTPVVELAGKYIVRQIYLSGVASNNTVDVRLTIDDVLIWDDVLTPSGTGTQFLFDSSGVDEYFVVEESLKLELKTSADPSITVSYQVRPIE